MNEIIKSKLTTIPDLPGSYQMLDVMGNIIYVGKAKNLKNRIKTYFVGSHDAKTTRLVTDITDFTFIVTATELEAFLLELSLIKQYSPKYNIMLMDDKTYPYIEVTNETHPRLIITRKFSKKNKNLFGPFPDAASARETVNLLSRIFPLRKCQAMPKKVCLYFHMGQCLGPCIDESVQTQYPAIIDQICRFLGGHNQDLLNDLNNRMNDYSTHLEYEKAQEIRDMIFSLQKTTEKQQIIFPDLKDRDIINFAANEAYITITTIFMRAGKIVMSISPIFEYFESQEDTFVDYLAQFYQKNPLPQEVLLPLGIDYSLLKPFLLEKGFTPSRGGKAKLVQMAKANAQIQLDSHLDLFLKKYANTVGSAEILGKTIGIATPKRIEAFDNSNTMGSNPVSAMVVFTNGLPDKKEYRKYQVKSVTQPDDVGTMKEIIYRRYQKMLMNGASDKPNLIVMDGGIAQVRACKTILKELYLDIPVIGLRKDSEHKTDAIIGLDEQPIILDRHSHMYVFLSKIQDEAHRFAITYHRSQHTKQIFASILDSIPKIGVKSKQKLLEKYKTISNIKKAPIPELKTLGLTNIAIDNLQIALKEYK
ncbi:MAG: excinuclease ABC subunit UvrC [Candidatus Izemoplasmatales bacterium]|nr:excinuclease ABC subunit UvrC [Candidatus Izemoplasmatales bacterium]MDD3865281.1 excinuclease ABC subunit UvrC [Candidatus Izemoplasmatales bacterium]